jgi:hypothetical protein
VLLALKALLTLAQGLQMSGILGERAQTQRCPARIHLSLILDRKWFQIALSAAL